MKNPFPLLVAISMFSCESGEEPQPETWDMEGRWIVYFEEHEQCHIETGNCIMHTLEEQESFLISEMLFKGDSAFFYNHLAEDGVYGKFYYTIQQDTLRIDLGEQAEEYGIFLIDRKSDQRVTFTNAFYNQDSSYYFVDVYHVRRP